jgi:hypothetical protein
MSKRWIAPLVITLFFSFTSANSWGRGEPVVLSDSVAVKQGKRYTLRVLSESDQVEEVVIGEYDYSPDYTGQLRFRVELKEKAGIGPLLDEQDSLSGKQKRRYAFDAEKGKEYTVEIYNQESSNSPLSYALGTQSNDNLFTNRAQWVEKNQTTYQVVNPTQSGPVLITVYPQEKQLDYLVKVYPSTTDGLDQSEITFEPNNTSSTAWGMVLGEQVDSALDESPEDWRDHYSFMGKKGQHYTVEILNHSSSSGDLYYSVGSKENLTKYSKQRHYINRGKSVYLEVVPTRSEPVFVLFEPADKKKQFDYTLKLFPSIEDGLVQSEITLEPNNTISTAVPIELGVVFDSTLEEGPEDWLDHYAFYAEKGKQYTFELLNPTGNSSDIYYSIGTEKDKVKYSKQQHYLNRGKSLYQEITPNRTGKVVITVKGADRNKQFDYQVKLFAAVVDGQLQSEITYEPNNTVSTAMPIELGATIESSLEESAEDWMDHYSFYAEKGKNYRFSLENMSSSYSDIYYAIGSVKNHKKYSRQYKYVNKGKKANLEFAASKTEDVVIYLKAPNHNE